MMKMIASGPSVLRSCGLRLLGAVAMTMPLLLLGCGGGGGGGAEAAEPPPTLANFSITYLSVGTGQDPLFGATGTGTPTRYEWDFGDGTTLITTTAEAPHVYRDAGEYTLKLIVSDASGRTAETSRKVNVQPPAPAVEVQVGNAWFGMAPGNAVLRFSANLLLYRTGVAIPPNTRFEWTFSDGGTAQGIVVNHRFTQGGTQTATVKVTDVNGASAEATAAVQITAALLPLSTHTGGAAWVDGRGTAARLGWANRLLVDAAREQAWIWDWLEESEVLRRIDLRTGDVVTLPAGKGGSPGRGAGSSTDHLPWTSAAAIDPTTGELIVATSDTDSPVFRVASDGDIRLLFTNWTATDDQGKRLYETARAVTVGRSGEIYIADGHAVFVYKANRLRLLAGDFSTAGVDDGAALQARFGRIQGLAALPDGSLMIADGCLRVRRLSMEGQVSTVIRADDSAIDGGCVGDFQPAPDGGFLVSTWADGFQHGDAEGRLTPLADGTYVTQNLRGVDREGRTLYMDRSGTQLMRIYSNGVALPVAGKSAWKDGTDSLPAGLPDDLKPVEGWAMHPDGSLYFFDAGRMKRLDGVTGQVSAVYGAPVDQPTQVQPVTTPWYGLSELSNLTIDAQGNVYFAEYKRLMRLGADGLVSTVAGSDTAVANADGTGPAADLTQLHSLAVDSHGVVYGIVGSRVVRVTPGGEVRTLRTTSGDQFVIKVLVDPQDRLLMLMNYGIYQYVDGAAPVLLSGPGGPTPGVTSTLIDDSAVVAPNGLVCRFSTFDNRLYCVRLDGSAAFALTGLGRVLAVDVPGASEPLQMTRHWTLAAFDRSGRLVVSGREGFSVFRTSVPVAAP